MNLEKKVYAIECDLCGSYCGELDECGPAISLRREDGVVIVSNAPWAGSLHLCPSCWTGLQAATVEDCTVDYSGMQVITRRDNVIVSSTPFNLLSMEIRSAKYRAGLMEPYKK